MFLYPRDKISIDEPLGGVHNCFVSAHIISHSKGLSRPNHIIFINNFYLFQRSTSMRWYKHFTNTSESNFMASVMDNFGHQGYAVYFLFLELCYEKIDENPDCKFRISSRIVRQKLRISSTKVQQMFNLFSTLDELSFKVDGTFFEFEVPKLLEFMDKDSKYNRKTLAKNSLNTRLELELEKEREEEKECKKEKEKPVSSKPRTARVPFVFSDDLKELVNTYKKLDIKDCVVEKESQQKKLASMVKATGKSCEFIAQCLRNYHLVRKSNDHYFSVDYSLGKFLGENSDGESIMEKFAPPKFKAEDFLHFKIKNSRFSSAKKAEDEFEKGLALIKERNRPSSFNTEGHVING